jgi:hypothetical protein
MMSRSQIAFLMKQTLIVVSAFRSPQGARDRLIPSNHLDRVTGPFSHIALRSEPGLDQPENQP